MTGRACIRGCTIRGEHYAACAGYGRSDHDCAGCVHAEAREGAMLCPRCYGQLRRRIELTPAIVEHLRELTHAVGRAQRYDLERSGTPDRHRAPADSDVLDALRDIMATIYAEPVDAGTSTARARAQAERATDHILANFDAIANDRDAALKWWAVTMPALIPEDPEFWTITRAASRWPLQERRHWADFPCPVCGFRTVLRTPPQRAGGLTWYSCTACHWDRDERTPESEPAPGTHAGTPSVQHANGGTA